ncbi:hypothetical protein [Treponema sp.]|uniref:hypothetical protein n=1 Tax=Treponema sp. TaxID=166 RepID=UPI003F0D129B
MGFCSLFSKNKKHFFFLFSALIAAFLAEAEPFRVRKTKFLSIDSLFEKKSVEAGVNDAVVIKLPADKTFIEGIEISVKVPKPVAEWRDSVAWSLYSEISPAPETETIDYNGTRLEVGTFTESLSFNIKIPTKKNHSIKSDVYSYTVQTIPLNDGDFIFFRLQLAMKGSSDSVSKSKFTVSAYPILSNEGALSLSVKQPEKEAKDFTVFVDGKQSELGKSDVILSAGRHNVSIVSDFYRNEVRAVTVEQAKTTRMDVALRDIKPIVRLIAPEGTKIQFDKMEFTAPAEQFYTTAGDHVVKFMVGDYEITKTVSAVDGRSYNISVNIDASIEESDE